MAELVQLVSAYLLIVERGPQWQIYEYRRALRQLVGELS